MNENDFHVKNNYQPKHRQDPEDPEVIVARMTVDEVPEGYTEFGVYPRIHE